MQFARLAVRSLQGGQPRSACGNTRDAAQPMPSRNDRELPRRPRQTITALPGARFLHEGLFETPVSWLYRRPTLWWLSDPALVRQLPRLYRVFARYCAAQRYEPIGAEMLVHGIIAGCAGG
ncbi:MAG: hypothetical protein H6Q86_56 [candidate division NC10 bacterium]|nr:hypothetical protein [candidate division NC10 bacterium]